MSRKDLANAIRALSMDAVQKANSGHPGAPMGMADIAEVLWNDFLKRGNCIFYGFCLLRRDSKPGSISGLHVVLRGLKMRAL
ncbi:hypothetical protein N7242_20745, partial [Escherichia coli]|nr:hypothetical protein [Escherichia coli]